MQVHAAAITNKLNEQNKMNRNADNKHHDVDSDNCCITAATEAAAEAAVATTATKSHLGYRQKQQQQQQQHD